MCPSNSPHPEPARILVVDDEEPFREFICEALSLQGYSVISYDPGNSDPSLLDNVYDVAIVDLIFPQSDGFEIRKRVLRSSPDTQFILVTGLPDKDKMERAMDLAVYGMLIKPFSMVQIRYAVIGALRVRRLLRSDLEKRSAMLTTESLGLIGSSVALRGIRRQILEFAPLDIPILITGESGTGKEVVARAIQQNSHRAAKPFVAINCASLSPHLIESELFGHVQGAFTGAAKTKHGFFELAHGGTLFLDEIGDLPAELQSKFLRVLDHGEFMRVGEGQMRKANVRIISATNRDLAGMVSENRFRRDLFYRLRGSQIRLAPLRERKEDIPALVRHFLGDEDIAVTPEAAVLLMQFDWPGNVRELSMCVAGLRGLATKKMITAEHVHRQLGIGDPVKTESGHTYAEFKKHVVGKSERAYFESVLKSNGGNIAKAAAFCGLHRKNFYQKLKQHKIPLKTPASAEFAGPS